MKEKIKNAVLASFVADALCLGVHWEYDVQKIKDKYGHIDHMIDPALVPYHKEKKAGDFTHYGDQMLVLLESVKAVSGFDPVDFSDRWQKLFSTYKGYMDHATKETRINLLNGKSYEQAGSGSTDLAGASRIVPLFLYYSGDTEKMLEDVRLQTAMTHNHHDVIDAALWFALTSINILNGQEPNKAMQSAAHGYGPNPAITSMVEKGIQSRTKDTIQVVKGFGQMCAWQAALPGAVHLVAKFGDDYKKAMIENAMAGGDSSARGIMAGFLIGCAQSDRFVPDQWLKGMTAYEKIKAVLE